MPVASDMCFFDSEGFFAILQKQGKSISEHVA